MQRPSSGLCRGNQKRESVTPPSKTVNKLGPQDESEKVQEKIKEKIHWSIREEKFLELDCEISHRHFSVSIRGSEFTFGKTPAKMLSHKTDCSFIDL